MTYNDAIASAARYGVREDNPLPSADYHQSVDHTDPLTLNELDAQGGRVTRLRLLTERGYPFYDISYAHGVLPSGQVVALRTDGCPDRLRRSCLKSDLIAWAREQGVSAKRLGLLDEGNWSRLFG
jgi:hypothetical protein